MPCLTLDGKLILETRSRVAMAPAGNGGVYAALQQCALQLLPVESVLCYVSHYFLVNMSQRLKVWLIPMNVSGVGSLMTWPSMGWKPLTVSALTMRLSGLAIRSLLATAGRNKLIVVRFPVMHTTYIACQLAKDAAANF